MTNRTQNLGSTTSIFYQSTLCQLVDFEKEYRHINLDFFQNMEPKLPKNGLIGIHHQPSDFAHLISRLAVLISHSIGWPGQGS